MEVNDSTRFTEYESAARVEKARREYNHAILTYTDTVETDQGRCERRIYRAIGNDSGCKVEMTRALLSKYEPRVGAWPGDRIEYWKDNKLLKREEY